MFAALPKKLFKIQQHMVCVLLFTFISVIYSFSQEILISGEESVLQNNSLGTKMQYEQEAYQAAVQNALDKAFGSSVTSNYERLTITEMEGRSVSANSDIRNNYLNTYPNGIWVQDKSRKCYEEKDEKGHWWTTCKVTGLARKMEAAEVRFIARTLDGTDPVKNQTETFVSGERGYLYFKCSLPGHIIVFYDDMKNVQRCLPYNLSEDFDLKIEANKEYLFFSSQYADSPENKNKVDEIEFFSEIPVDYNQFIIVFSPQPFKGYFLNSEEEFEDGYTTFKSLSKDSFHAWLQENRIRNNDLQVQIIGITIRGMNKD